MTDTITNSAVTTVTVHQDRLWESLMTLARTGADDDTRDRAGRG